MLYFLIFYVVGAKSSTHIKNVWQLNFLVERLALTQADFKELCF